MRKSAEMVKAEKDAIRSVRRPRKRHRVPFNYDLAAEVLGITVSDIRQAEAEAAYALNDAGSWQTNPKGGVAFVLGDLAFVITPSGRTVGLPKTEWLSPTPTPTPAPKPEPKIAPKRRKKTNGHRNNHKGTRKRTRTNQSTGIRARTHSGRKGLARKRTRPRQKRKST